MNTKGFIHKNRTTLGILFNALVVCLMLFCFIACKKNKNTEPECEPTNEVVNTSYSKLKVGNYWIYQHFIVDSLDNGTAINTFDSCYIQKDTVINGNTYFKEFRPDYTSYEKWVYTRDSLHYTIKLFPGFTFTTSTSQIVFSPTDTNRIFYRHDRTYTDSTGKVDTIVTITTKMTDTDYIKNTPAGNFKTINFKLNYKIHVGSPFGLNIPVNTRYAKGIGIVSERLPFGNNQTYNKERRLVRYKVN